MAQGITSDIQRPRGGETVVTLQLLRGIAAVLVVFAHSIDYQQMCVPGNSTLTSFYALENFGAVGVDIFFVISGFIMALVTPDGGEERAAFRFAGKRILRIVPNYWLLTIVTILVRESAGDATLMARAIASFTFVPLYPQGKFLAPVILVGWSLSFEMYFYLLITLLLATGKRGSMVSIVAWTCVGLALVGICGGPHGTFAAFAFNPLLAEFAIGCLIGRIYRRRQSDLPWRISFFLLGCGLLGLLISLLVGFGSISEIDSTIMGDVGTRRLFIWGVPCGLLVAGLVGSERRWRHLVPDAWRLVGDASYSIYLIQLLALRAFAQRWSLAGFGHPDLFIVCSMIFAVLAGIAHFGIIEKPLTAWLSDRFLGVSRTAQSSAPPIDLAHVSGMPQQMPR